VGKPKQLLSKVVQTVSQPTLRNSRRVGHPLFGFASRRQNKKGGAPGNNDQAMSGWRRMFAFSQKSNIGMSTFCICCNSGCLRT
jgi:hypothetical protein